MGGEAATTSAMRFRNEIPCQNLDVLLSSLRAAGSQKGNSVCKEDENSATSTSVIFLSGSHVYYEWPLFQRKLVCRLSGGNNAPQRDTSVTR